MPIYSYICDVCGKVQEVVRSMEAESTIPPECCNRPTRRSYKDDLPRVGNRDYAKPIHSDSLAIMPNQRKEHERLFPNIKLDDENRPVFTNFKDHDDYLKKTGFVKQRQKVKRKATRIL